MVGGIYLNAYEVIDTNVECGRWDREWEMGVREFGNPKMWDMINSIVKQFGMWKIGGTTTVEGEYPYMCVTHHMIGGNVTY